MNNLPARDINIIINNVFFVFHGYPSGNRWAKKNAYPHEKIHDLVDVIVWWVLPPLARHIVRIIALDYSYAMSVPAGLQREAGNGGAKKMHRNSAMHHFGGRF